MATKQIKAATFEEMNKVKSKLERVYNADNYTFKIVDLGNSFLLEIRTKATYKTMFSATIHEFLTIARRAGFLYWIDIDDNEPRICIHGN